MPYIKKEQREIIDREIDELINKTKTIDSFESDRGGILNYIITRLALEFRGKESYKNLSLMKSAMVDASDEWTRRQMNPYEDKKIVENGDILPLKEEEEEEETGIRYVGGEIE